MGVVHPVILVESSRRRSSMESGKTTTSRSPGSILTHHDGPEVLQARRPCEIRPGWVPAPGHHGAKDTLGQVLAPGHHDPVPELAMKLPLLFVYTALTELAVIGPQVVVDAAVALAVSVTVQKVVVPSVKVTVPVGLLGAGS